MSAVSSNYDTTSHGIRWWQSLSVAISAFLFPAIIVVGVSTVFNISDSTTTVILIYILSSVLTIGLVWGFLKFKKVTISEFVGKFYLDHLIFTPIYYVAYLLISKISQETVRLLFKANLDQAQDFGLVSDSPISLVGIFLAIVVLTPLAEELVFRGLLLKGFAKSFGRLGTAIFVSLLFGAAHGQWNVAADTFALSLVLIYLVDKSGSLWPAIILHVFKNTVAFLLVFVFS